MHYSNRSPYGALVGAAALGFGIALVPHFLPEIRSGTSYLMLLVVWAAMSAYRTSHDLIEAHSSPWTTTLLAAGGTPSSIARSRLAMMAYQAGWCGAVSGVAFELISNDAFSVERILGVAWIGIGHTLLAAVITPILIDVGAVLGTVLALHGLPLLARSVPGAGEPTGWLNFLSYLRPPGVELPNLVPIVLYGLGALALIDLSSRWKFGRVS